MAILHERKAEILGILPKDLAKHMTTYQVAVGLGLVAPADIVSVSQTLHDMADHGQIVSGEVRRGHAYWGRKPTAEETGHIYTPPAF